MAGRGVHLHFCSSTKCGASCYRPTRPEKIATAISRLTPQQSFPQHTSAQHTRHLPFPKPAYGTNAHPCSSPSNCSLKNSPALQEAFSQHTSMLRTHLKPYGLVLDVIGIAKQTPKPDYVTGGGPRCFLPSFPASAIAVSRRLRRKSM